MNDVCRTIHYATNRADAPYGQGLCNICKTHYGPASVKTLLRFASRCGVNATAAVMAKYGISITQILNTAGPVALIDEFTERLRLSVHGDVKFHFYPFGGLKKAVEWVHHYAMASAVSAQSGQV